MKVSLLIIIVILILGVLLYITNMHNPRKTLREQEKSLKLRKLGIFLFIISLILGLLYLYLQPRKLKAQLPGSACISCDEYRVRSNALRPYTEQEYSILAKKVGDCKNCSDQCMQYLEKNPNVKQECINVTRSALGARKEFDRMTEKLQAKKNAIDTHLLRHGPKDVFLEKRLFPSVPKGGF
jgi:hypothetical protein